MSPVRRKLTFLIVAVALAASAAGAYAASQSSVSPRQAFLNDVAHRLHVTPTQLRKAMAGAFADRLSALVASGRLTRAQADAIEQRVRSSGRLPGFGWFGMAGFGRAFRPGLRRGWYAYPPAWPAAPGAKLPPRAQVLPNGKVPPGPPFPPGAVMPAGPPVPPGVAAVPMPLPLLAPVGFLVPGGIRAALAYLGVGPDQLVSELRSGKSLAQIARSHGKTAGGLEAALRASIQRRLSRAVAANVLTRAEAGKITRAIDARVATMINMKVKLPPAGFRVYRLRGLHRFRLVPHGRARGHLHGFFFGG